MHLPGFEHVHHEHGQHDNPGNQGAQSSPLQSHFGEPELTVNQHPVAEYIQQIPPEQQKHRHQRTAYSVSQLLQDIEPQSKYGGHRHYYIVPLNQRQKFRSLSESSQHKIKHRKQHQPHGPDNPVHNDAVFDGGTYPFYVVGPVQRPDYRHHSAGESHFGHDEQIDNIVHE